MPSILTRPSGGGAAPAPSGGYVPPSDWLELPSITAGENKFAGVVAVWDVSTNYVTIEVTVDSGTWSVDWGDGNSQTGIASGTVAEHNLSYAGATGDLTTRGYKTALVVVTTSGGNITEINLENQHSSATSDIIAPWLNIRLAGSSITNFQIKTGAFGVDFYLLEQLDFVGTNSITANGSRFLYFLSGLRKVVNLDTSTFTSVNQFLQSTDVLQELPTIDLSNVSNIQQDFVSQGLPKISLSNLGSITTMQQAFTTSNYIEVEADGSATTALTNMNIAFRTNPLLVKLPDLGDTSAVSVWQWAFRDCKSLREIPAYDLSGGTNFSLWMSGSPSISRILAYGATVTHSIADLNLGVTEIEEYATNLGDGTGQTITTSGNPASGSWDTTIATNKNWTVVD